MTYHVLINGHAQSSKGVYLVYLLIYTVTVVGPLLQTWSSLPIYLAGILCALNAFAIIFVTVSDPSPNASLFWISYHGKSTYKTADTYGLLRNCYNKKTR